MGEWDLGYSLFLCGKDLPLPHMLTAKGRNRLFKAEDTQWITTFVWQKAITGLEISRPYCISPCPRTSVLSRVWSHRFCRQTASHSCRPRLVRSAEAQETEINVMCLWTGLETCPSLDKATIHCFRKRTLQCLAMLNDESSSNVWVLSSQHSPLIWWNHWE